MQRNLYRTCGRIRRNTLWICGSVYPRKRLDSDNKADLDRATRNGTRPEQKRRAWPCNQQRIWTVQPETGLDQSKKRRIWTVQPATGLDPRKRRIWTAEPEEGQLPVFYGPFVLFEIKGLIPLCRWKWLTGCCRDWRCMEPESYVVTSVSISLSKTQLPTFVLRGCDSISLVPYVAGPILTTICDCAWVLTVLCADYRRLRHYY